MGKFNIHQKLVEYQLKSDFKQFCQQILNRTEFRCQICHKISNQGGPIPFVSLNLNLKKFKSKSIKQKLTFASKTVGSQHLSERSGRFERGFSTCFVL